jgi:hypothetical protein
VHTERLLFQHFYFLRKGLNRQDLKDRQDLLERFAVFGVFVVFNALPEPGITLIDLLFIKLPFSLFAKAAVFAGEHLLSRLIPFELPFQPC